MSFRRMWAEAFTDFSNFEGGKKVIKTNSYSPAMPYVFYLSSNKSSGQTDQWQKLKIHHRMQLRKTMRYEYTMLFFSIRLLSEGSCSWINDLGLLLVFCFQKTEPKRCLTISTPWGNAVPSQSFLGKRWIILPHPSPDPKIYRRRKRNY